MGFGFIVDRRIVLAAAFLAGATTGPALAAECDLFVRASRSQMGSGNGRSPEQAFVSVSEAAAAIDNPGIVVCVGPGRYAEGDISPPVNGSAVSRIVFHADPSGAATGDPPGAVQIVADGTATGAAFLLLGKRYIVIEGFTIDGFTDAGIQVRSGPTESAGNSSDITLRGNIIRDCGAGIDVSAEGIITVENNDVLNSTSAGIGISGCRGTVLGGIKCRAGESGRVVPVLSNNRVVYNFSHGVFLHEASGGTVQNTIAFGNLTGIMLRSAANVTVVNNLVYGNASDGISIGAAGQFSAGARLLNNTVFGNGGWGVRIGDESSASDNALVLNNVIAENGGGSIAVSRASTCGYVAGYNLSDLRSSYGPDTPVNTSYDLRADPRFVNPAGPDGILGWQVRDGVLSDFSADDDFHLAAGSPGIDAGYSTAAVLGLEGASRADAGSDDGAIDLGYHYGASAAQTIRNVAEPFMPLFVRVSGSDSSNGRTAATALASLNLAAQAAKAGVTVLVGPGSYAAANVGPTPYSGKVTFRADAAGTFTGDPAGPVLIDPSVLPSGVSKDTGFLLLRTCAVTIDGFHVRFAGDAGIQVREGADASVVRNNVVFTNKRGISVIDANDVQIVNNLVYDNDTGGIDVGGSSIAGRTRLQNNTVYGNVKGNGITIGVGTAATPKAQLEYNIVVKNGSNGIYARESYTGRYNLVADNGDGAFGGIAGRKDGDKVDMDPLFTDPAGEDGRVGGRRFEDDRFELRQPSVGDAVTSPAVDAGPITAEKAGVASGTTRIDGEADAGLVDLGFHYAARPPDVLYVDPNGSNSNSGRFPELPLRTITEALRQAVTGTTVHISAGTYREANLRPGAGVRIVGAGVDKSTLDAAGESVGLDIRQADVLVQAIGITAATDVGIRVRGSGVQIVDCAVHDNAARGIVIAEGSGSLVFNNLIYRNGSTGVVIGSAQAAADRATIVHNTIFANAGFGVTVGLDAAVPSAGASVASNIILGQTLKGLGVGGDSALTLHVGHNCNRDGYRGIEKPESDLVTDDPLLLDPAETPPDFRLEQIAAGDLQTSPCVDAAFRTAAQIGLSETTTRRDEQPDLGLADVGYHYGLQTFDAGLIPLLRFGGPMGDCNEDGATRVNDLVTGVNIALGSAAIDGCPTLDINGDGRVTINELLSAVNELLGE